MKILLPILLCFLSVSVLSQEHDSMPDAIKIPKRAFVNAGGEVDKPLYVWRELIISDSVGRNQLRNLILERVQDGTLTAYIKPYSKTQQEQTTTAKLLALAKEHSDSINRLLFYEVWTFNTTLHRMEVEIISVAPAYQSNNNLQPLLWVNYPELTKQTQELFIYSTKDTSVTFPVYMKERLFVSKLLKYK